MKREESGNCWERQQYTVGGGGGGGHFKMETDQYPGHITDIQKKGEKHTF